MFYYVVANHSLFLQFLSVSLLMLSMLYNLEGQPFKKYKHTTNIATCHYFTCNTNMQIESNCSFLFFSIPIPVLMVVVSRWLVRVRAWKSLDQDHLLSVTEQGAVTSTPPLIHTGCLQSKTEICSESPGPRHSNKIHCKHVSAGAQCV